METVKLIVLCVFTGIGITAFFYLTVAKLLTKFYDIGKKKKEKKKGVDRV